MVKYGKMTCKISYSSMFLFLYKRFSNPKNAELRKNDQKIIQP